LVMQVIACLARVEHIIAHIGNRLL
jgi:hypothetical protein